MRSHYPVCTWVLQVSRLTDTKSVFRAFPLQVSRLTDT